MKKVMLVFGTRPEAIKMCPLVKELDKHPFFETVVCVTGQHREMLDQVLEVFDIEPKYDLNLMKSNQTLFDITVGILNSIQDILAKEKPDIVLVHGDTTTTYATALACFYLGIKIGHVEAGLRTYNMQKPFPEEFNRQSVSLIANYHFAPTQAAADNLLREGKEQTNIFVTGNTGIDALNYTITKDFEHPLLDWIGDDKLIMITAHRRESLGEPMQNMFEAVRQLVADIPNLKVIYPVHLNPTIRNLAEEVFGNNNKIKLVAPLSVVDFQNLMAKSTLILTDSGGIQEEAPALNIPVLVMRDVTERPEGVEAGTLKIVGTKARNIYQNCKELLEDKTNYQKMVNAQNPYGNGHASEKICQILEEKLK